MVWASYSLQALMHEKCDPVSFHILNVIYVVFRFPYLLPFIFLNLFYCFMWKYISYYLSFQFILLLRTSSVEYYYLSRITQKISRKIWFNIAVIFMELKLISFYKKQKLILFSRAKNGMPKCFWVSLHFVLISHSLHYLEK